MRHPLAALLTLVLTLVAAPLVAQDVDSAGEASLLDRINAIRAQAGAGPLARDGSLDAAARVHSAEMASVDQLMHVSPTTGTPVDRVHAVGHDTGEVAENVAMHTGAAEAQQALEASDAHLANMLNPRFTHLGVSVVRDESGVYVTEVFARIEAPAAPEAAPVAPAIAAPAAPMLEAPAVTAPSMAAPTVAAPTVAAPTVAAPTVAAPTVAAPAIASPAAGAIGAPGQVVTIRSPEGATAGFWVCGSGRWWYYPMPSGTTSGQLQADTSVSGSPPGFGGCAAGAAGAVAIGGAPSGGGVPAAAYAAPSGGVYGARGGGAVYVAPRVVQPGVIGPWGGVRVVGPQPYPARPYAPRPYYGPQPYGRRVIIVR
jgi:hypothetical protein